MWVMLCGELKAATKRSARAGRTMVRPLPADQARREVGRTDLRHLAEIYADGCIAYEQLNRLYRRIDEFVALNETLGRKSAFVNRLTDELRISSINVALASTRLGNEGLSLSVISRHMGDTSGQVAGSVHGMVAGINAFSGRLRGVIFDIAAARLQVEMVLTFIHELLMQPTWPTRGVNAAPRSIRCTALSPPRSATRATPSTNWKPPSIRSASWPRISRTT